MSYGFCLFERTRIEVEGKFYIKTPSLFLGVELNTFLKEFR